MAEKAEGKATPEFKFPSLSFGSSTSSTSVTSDSGKTPQSLFSLTEVSQPVTSGSSAVHTTPPCAFSLGAASKPLTSESGNAQTTHQNVFSSFASSKPVTFDSLATETTSQSLFSFSAPNLMIGKENAALAAIPTFTTSRDARQKNKTNNNIKAFLLESPWRQVDWTEETKNALMESIRSYKPACDSVPAARVLLVGPVGAGKSSFISSVQSVFYGRVLNRAMVGTSFNPTTSFTKQLQSFNIHGTKERQDMAVILSDMAGLEETNGLTLNDTVAVIKGHVPDGHKFSACCPVVSDTPGYVKDPSLAERVHCVVFVLSASDISSISQTMKSTFHQLREHITALGVHQVALLTHVDKVCPKTASDTSQVYKSSLLKAMMLKVSDLLGMPLSSIVPVKNYSEELELDTHTDTLLLKALDHILQYVDLHLSDQPTHL